MKKFAAICIEPAVCQNERTDSPRVAVLRMGPGRAAVPSGETMSTGQGTQGAGFAYETGDLMLVTRALETQTGVPGASATALQLASVLQTSLELDRLVEIFSRQIQHLVPHGGMSFENRSLDISISVGDVEKNTCSYQLVLNSQTLGQLVISRKGKFSEPEKILLEHLVCCLVYPLRNALLYRAAVKAALKDPLTGANNRAAMNGILIRETELARRYGAPLSLVALDIDHFKAINDRHGHLAGDHILKCVAEAIAECTRRSDIVFRSGGEEFLIVLSNTARQGALMLAERVRRNIESCEHQHGEHLITVTVSLGVSCFRTGDDSESLYEKADMALYAAKSAGRNCVKFYE